ncbi:phage tail protein [Sphingomonas sp.]|jgi:microcystin-dependent protein|uniref:phage tail protein n=1 Tax=Sphingomonas sp. TaxID=28214 RepID=UPI00262C86AF|nr:tail fiber protein [Sphingomonas sp.]MDK2766238.1 tail fiber protein [Sphingomonas sp.]
MATPFIGQLLTVGFNWAPRNYATCSGQILSIAQNTALFSLLGTTYGGNGQTTFALPDLRGRVAIGQGQGGGLSNRTLGEMAGTENTTLLSTQMPQHVHSLSGVTGTLNAVDVKATEQSPQAGAYLARGVDSAPMPDSIPEIYLPAAQGDPATKVPLAGVNVAGNTAIAGGSQPFSTMQPYLVLNPCIALQGIYPSRN